MPRPSLKAERTKEILDAFMTCVARYGLDGSTLERISGQAGIGRPLLRHYLGNRNEMILQLLDHVVSKFIALTRITADSLPLENRFDFLMEALFEREDHSSENAAVFQALVAASERYPEVRKPLLKFVTQFEAFIAKEISREKPHADIESCKIAASGLTAIYFNTDAIRPLKPTRTWRSYQRQAAQGLVDML